MIRTRTALLVTLLLTVLVAPVAEAGWLHQANSVFLAVKSSQRQPAKIDQMIVNPYDSGSYSICTFFAHGAKQRNKGKFVTKVRIEDGEGNVERRMKLAANVKNGAAWKCKDGTDLKAGGVVYFAHKLKQMPHLRKVNGRPQGSAITGVISTDGKPAIGDGPLALKPPQGEIARGFVPASESGWFHSANSVYQVRKNKTNHPDSLSQIIQVPRDTGSRPYICSAYSSADEVPKGKGMVDSDVTISYSNGNTETLQLSGEVENHVHTVCEKASKKLKKGDLVAFDHNLSEMPKLDKGEHADLVGAVSTAGEPAFRGGGGNDGGGETPGPGKIFSVQDEHAITRLFSQASNQLKRRKNNQPGYWVITTRRTTPDDFSTQGVGSTPAAALADYEKKMGGIGGQGNARLLTKSERSALEWYHGLNTSGGSTSLRTDGSRKFKADVYRPHLGVRIGGPYATLEQAVRFMQDLGLQSSN